MKTKLLFFFLLFCLGSKAQIINIPDAAFKYALTHGYPNNHGFDTNSDGEIDQDEANAVTSININTNTNVHDITGIRQFNNLEYLRLNNTRIYEIDLHDMASLKTLICLYNHGTLGSINLSGCSSLEMLTASVNPVQSLHLSGAVALKEIAMESTLLEQVDLTGLVNLEKVNFSKSALANVTVGNLPKLKFFRIDQSYSRNLESLDFSGCPALETIWADYSGLRSLNVKNLGNLKTIRSNGNRLQSLDISGNTSLASLFCDYNELESLVMDNTGNLMSLSCNYNKLASLVVNNNKKLKELECAYNRIETLDLSDLSTLEQPERNIDCSHNALKTLKLQNTEVSHLDASYNAFIQFDISWHSRLMELNLEQNPKLAYLNMANLEASPIMDNVNYKLVLDGNYSLFFVCADSWLVYKVKNYANSIGLNPKVNEKCQIAPIVAPNPTYDHVVVNGIENFTLFKLYDISGKLLRYYGSGTNSEYIDLSDFSPGIYLLQMFTESGFGNDTRKIIKM
ncbi:T9SS type A sorting domain-containing protein [Flavobacterium sp.]|uniref:T9SS type A sorting domain-containing protein n=1 Tax=Flavobacterium sp. TaxID=239 RepID=UPI0039E2A4F4